MTYLELLNNLANMTPRQLNQDITILLMNEDEVFMVTDFVSNWPSDPDEKQSCGVDQVKDVLDLNHPYFTVIT